MSPFRQLREPDRPVAPDARFAARLKARVVEALAAAHVPTIELPERRSAMSSTTSPTTSQPTDAGEVAIVPYLAVHDASAAISWYAEVFDAVETIRYTGDDGRIGHAELLVNGSTLMLSDEYPDYGAVSPRSLQGTPVMLHLRVDDVDAVHARAVAAGATSQREPADQPYGERTCTIVDPFGHRWMVQTPIATPTVEDVQAATTDFTITTPPAAATSPAGPPIEIGYVTIGFDDTTAATRFYTALFGWDTEPGNAGDEYVHVSNTRLPLGFTPDGSATPPELYFRVDDVEAFAGRVRDLGGAVVSTTTHASGQSAVCRDDQGREFHLWQPAPGY